MTETKPRKTRTKKIKEDTIELIVTPTDNKLSFDDIKNDDKQFDELIRVEFSNGKYTEIKAKFRPTDINKMLEDFSSFLSDYQKLDRVITNRDILDYLNLHIVLHFSNIVGTVPTDIYEKVDLFQQILNSECGEAIMESFDKNEVVKVHTHMQKTMEQFMQMTETNKELKQQLKEKVSEMNLENKDIIMSTMFGEGGEFA
jgi:hypothetical protein